MDYFRCALMAVVTCGYNDTGADFYRVYVQSPEREQQTTSKVWVRNHNR
jgi:hypothetical protein